MTTTTHTPALAGIEQDEVAEWFESLSDFVARHGSARAERLLGAMWQRLDSAGRQPAFNSPFINTIAPADQPDYPGDLQLEHQIESLIRWNAMAMVVRANRAHEGIGGHLSSFASLCTLFEVGFHHFFKAATEDRPGDLVYLHGHSSPGVYARAYLEGRLEEKLLGRFRREAPRGTGLSSYPHPWLMPDFWQFPTVSMGLAPLQAVYQARFLRYLANRGIADTSAARVWCFIGDGEMDEPESTAALTLASRERLDNLVFVINCNLQRLDGPVRGNGKIIQELEALFCGAGWNCIKVVWGSGWDRLLEADHSGLLVQRMEDTLDGHYQKFCVEPGAYFREHFFGHAPELLQLVEDYSDADLEELNRDRGGHDDRKVYAAYHAAVNHRGRPTVVLANTIKGYGLGEAGEAQNVTHKAKALDPEELHAFRQRFHVPLTDEGAEDLPFYKPSDESEESRYLHERRRELGGYLPARRTDPAVLPIPERDVFETLLAGGTGTTTAAFDRLLTTLLKDDDLGPRVVPIIPDEARTFGLQTLFADAGIYTELGQQYEPVDAGMLVHYREARDGQVLEEGITEAGAMASFIAAGTSYAHLATPMVPFYLFYSMFGFQRVGDLIWAAADARARGFLLGCTAGRTTLQGEGLQHQDGHSPLIAACVPTVRAYDPAYGYELAVIVHDGLYRMFQQDEQLIYYLTLYNEAVDMPSFPQEHTDGILQGLYRVSPGGNDDDPARVQLFGSGTILPVVLEAQRLLSDRFGIDSDVWSATSYPELRRDALAAQRWNRLHPGEEPRASYLERALGRLEGPFVAATDYVRALPDLIAPWIPGRYVTLGTDGFGRSDTREALRRHFEIDAACMTYAALEALAGDGRYPVEELPAAFEQLEIDPEKLDPALA